MIGTYDNPYRESPTPCPDAGNPTLIFLANVVLEAEPFGFIPSGLHDLIRVSAERYNIEVAEVLEKLDEPGDWFDCRHPTDSGYDEVRGAFLKVFGPKPAG